LEGGAPVQTNAADAYILGLLAQDREALLTQMIDTVYVSGQATIDRTSVEQLLRGVVAVLEEWLAGESDDIRRSFLDAALPDLARSGMSPWSAVLRDGLPCWGVLLGILSARAEESRRTEVVHRLALILGEWWAAVWQAMYPAYKEKGEL
jgi:hypothetical protein